jgi:formylglycine-generating enzyme required for sulfatase activity
MNTVGQILLIGVVGITLVTAQAQEAGTVLRKVEEQVRPVLAHLTPVPTIEYPEHTQSMVIRYRPRKFLVHGSNKAGEWSADAREEIGPSSTGFVLQVNLQKRGEPNQTDTPATIQEPYWRTFLDVTPIAGSANQVFWALSSGSRTDEKLLASLRQELGSLAGSETKTEAEHAAQKGLPETFVNSAKIKMIRVEKGEIMELETVKEDEFKKITITERYALAETETTVEQWLVLMKDNPDFEDGSNRVRKPPEHPVGGVSYKEAEEFCQRLTESDRRNGMLPLGYVYRLPTEEMWEYACRAGTKGSFPLPVIEIANHYWPGKNNAEFMTASDLKPNPWGFHHMNGNMLEWCQPGADIIGGQTISPAQRGGCYRFVAEGCRSGARRFSTDSSHPMYGFRVALVREP